MPQSEKTESQTCFTYAAALIGLACLSNAHASEPNRPENSFIILGPATTPEYMGSDDYSTVPMLVSEFSIGKAEFEIEGLTAQAAILGGNRWSFGITANFDMGRDEDVENSIIANFTEIDTAINVGGFASYGWDDQFLQGDNVEFKVEGYGDASDVHNGVFATAGVTYTFPLYIPWRFEFEFETTYGNDKYMDTYFGVSSADSVSSGLPRYAAGSSFRDVSLSANIGFFFNSKWGLFSRLSASRLLGDASDSPITSAGDENQYFAGVGFFYRF